MTNVTMTNVSTTRVAFAIAMISLIAVPADVRAAEWGSIQGRFVVDGEAPEPKPLVVTKDQFCIDTKPIDRSVVVDENGNLANAVVFLRVGRGKAIEAHPDYEATANEAVELDNKGCEFVPHVTLVRTGQPFIIKNSDPIGHNTNAKLMRNGQFNVLIAEGQENKMTFSKGEPLPLPVNCNIHPFMEGHLLVQDHPYMAVSGEDGTFEIKNIPAGEHEFQFWHESGYVRNADFEGGKTDSRGRADITVKAGGTLDLGDIQVSAAALK